MDSLKEINIVLFCCNLCFHCTDTTSGVLATPEGAVYCSVAGRRQWHTTVFIASGGSGEILNQHILVHVSACNSSNCSNVMCAIICGWLVQISRETFFFLFFSPVELHCGMLSYVVM